MLPIHVDYTLTIGDYRAAVYFGTAVRHRRSLMICALVLLVAAVYTVGASFGLWPGIMLPAYLALAYLIWLVVLLGGTELGILRYVKGEKKTLGRPMSLTLSEETLSFALDRDPGFSRPVKELFLVFETSRLFIIYLDPHQTVLLPMPTLTEEQRVTLRGLFGRKLKERFETRYGPTGRVKKKPSWLFWGRS